MKKRKYLIYAVVGAVIVLGLILSRTIDWTVDDDNASGNIAKSSHFSRKTADAGASTMQELLQNDEDFKNGVVTAYLVMKTRAQQFSALVDMSAEVAGNMPELEPVLKEMKEALPMIKNVCASMEAAGDGLNAALGGETVSDLEQNTSNAALAYNTLQKQNKLADKFIETVDKCLEKAAANDRLKFVRDQWVDYQQMTATLSQDENLAEELSKKGYLLSEDKRAAALGSFSEVNQMASLCSSSLASLCGVDNALSNTISTMNIDLSGALNAVDKSVMNAQDRSVMNAPDRSVMNASAQSAENLNAHSVLNAQEVSALNLMSVGAIDGLQHLQSSFQGAVINLSGAYMVGQMGQVTDVINALSTSELGAISVMNE